MTRQFLSRSFVVTCTLLAGTTLNASKLCHAAEKEPFAPFSDPDNRGGWAFDEAVSDEFEGTKLDRKKWWVEGTNGTFRKWSGRQPSQFSPDNVRVEDGKLKITARWQPNYNFLDKPDKNGQNYENITTGAVINNTMFRYGYLEAKVKPGLASVTGAFWLTGGKAELDIFELMGAPKQAHKQSKRKVWRINIIDWKSRVQTPVWKTYNDLDWEVGEAFHVYGCEWAPDHVAFFGDGKLINQVTREELGQKWILQSDMMLWFDSEVFAWNGLPEKEDLPVDYEIEYVRVWHKKQP
jgi:beta-glucanase (GH16 family)